MMKLEEEICLLHVVVYGLNEILMFTVMMGIALAAPVTNEQRLQIFKYSFIVLREILQRDVRIQCKARLLVNGLFL